MFLDEKLIISELYASHIDFKKKKSVFVTGRNHHAVTFRISGSVSIKSGGKELISRAGDITFVPKGLSYDTEVFEDGSMYAVHFQTAKEYPTLMHDVVSMAHPVVFSNLFSELVARYKPGRENDFYCMSMFYGILAEAKHEMYKKKNDRAASPRMRYAKEHIDRGFSDPALSVSYLAGEAGVSEVYFRREFGESFGMSPNSYIKKIRIENAKALLRAGYYSVTETAIRCGFDSISYFSYEFHRIVGMTPREYASKYC